MTKYDENEAFFHTVDAIDHSMTHSNQVVCQWLF